MKSALRNDTALVMLLFLASAITCVAGSYGIGSLYHWVVSPAVIHPEILIAPYRQMMEPEPDERFVFAALSSIIPSLSFIAAYCLMRNTVRPHRLMAQREWFMYVVAAFIFLIPLYEFEFSWWLIFDTHVDRWYPALLILLFLVSIGWYRASSARTTYTKSTGTFRLELGVFLAAMLLEIAAWRVVSVKSVFNYGAWGVHFDAAIYALSQVVMGKTILSDLPSQYGMAPEFLAPLFKLFGLSTLSFTIVCAGMQVVSLCCVWLVLYRCVRDCALRNVASIALVLLTFETIVFLIGIEERYFQYWPMRFFWPAVSVLMFYRYSRSRTLKSGALVSLVGSIGALWNADSGIMIVLAFAAFLGFKLLGAYAQSDGARNVRRALWQSAGIHCATIVLTPAVFFSYLTFKADGALHFSWLYEYQITFYKLGFTMMPMPTYPSAWMTVIAVYVMGLIVGIVGVVRGRQSWTLDNILFLSMLGVGLFIYYQGRSHILNLITVCWPAILVGAMLADRVLRMVRARQAERSMLVLPAAALGILAFCAVPFVWSVPKLLGSAITLFEDRHQAISPIVQDEIQFIRSHSTPGESCAILSARQGIYYAETKLVSPLRGPGYVETVLQRDLDSVLNQLSSRHLKCVFFGLGSSAQYLGPTIGEALQGYKVVATSRSGTLQYLIPSNGAFIE